LSNLSAPFSITQFFGDIISKYLQHPMVIFCRIRTMGRLPTLMEVEVLQIQGYFSSSIDTEGTTIHGLEARPVHFGSLRSPWV